MPPKALAGEAGLKGVTASRPVRSLPVTETESTSPCCRGLSLACHTTGHLVHAGKRKKKKNGVWGDLFHRTAQSHLSSESREKTNQKPMKG